MKFLQRRVALAVLPCLFVVPLGAQQQPKTVLLRVEPVQFDRDLAHVYWGYKTASGAVVIGEGKPITVIARLPTGKFVTLGRVGEGPGEYRDGALAFTMGDSIVIADPYRQTRTVLSVQSGKGATTRYMPGEKPPACNVLTLFDDAGICDIPLVDPTTRRRIGSQVYWFPAANNSRSPVLLQTLWDSAVMSRVTHRSARISIMRTVSMATRIANSPDGRTAMYVDQGHRGTLSTVAVRSVDLRTAKVRRWTIEYPAIPFTANARREYIETRTAAFLTAGTFEGLNSAEVASIVTDGLKLPDLYPPVLGVFVSNQGCAWLKRPPDSTSDTRQVFDVYGPDGHLRSRYVVGKRIGVLSVGCTDAVGVKFDADEVPMVVVLRNN
jgi:hypothetical protein